MRAHVEGASEISQSRKPLLGLPRHLGSVPGTCRKVEGEIHATESSLAPSGRLCRACP